MNRISIDIETFNKVMNVLGQLPYAQVASLLQEVQNNVEQVNGIDDVSADDASPSDNDSDSRVHSIHSKDQK